MELLTTITTNIAHVGIELLEIAAMGILLFGSGKIQTVACIRSGGRAAVSGASFRISHNKTAYKET